MCRASSESGARPRTATKASRVCLAADGDPVMEFDYSVPAEFFAGRALAYKRAILAYQRFDHAAEAIRFAMEELSPSLLRGSFM